MEMLELTHSIIDVGILQTRVCVTISLFLLKSSLSFPKIMQIIIQLQFCRLTHKCVLPFHSKSASANNYENTIRSLELIFNNILAAKTYYYFAFYTHLQFGKLDPLGGGGWWVGSEICPRKTSVPGFLSP